MVWKTVVLPALPRLPASSCSGGGSYASIGERRLRRVIPELSIPMGSLRIATVFFGPWPAPPKAIPLHDQGGSPGTLIRKVNEYHGRKY